MKAGIKFCGGCNPKFDRKKKADEIVARHWEYEWEYASADAEYDLLLVVCGCASCCADYRQYKYKDTVMVWDQEQNDF